jgi:hypothetical protein
MRLDELLELVSRTLRDPQRVLAWLGVAWWVYSSLRNTFGKRQAPKPETPPPLAAEAEPERRPEPAPGPLTPQRVTPQPASQIREEQRTERVAKALQELERRERTDRERTQDALHEGERGERSTELGAPKSIMTSKRGVMETLREREAQQRTRDVRGIGAGAASDAQARGLHERERARGDTFEQQGRRLRERDASEHASRGSSDEESRRLRERDARGDSFEEQGRRLQAGEDARRASRAPHPTVSGRARLAVPSRERPALDASTTRTGQAAAPVSLGDALLEGLKRAGSVLLETQGRGQASLGDALREGFKRVNEVLREAQSGGPTRESRPRAIDVRERESRDARPRDNQASERQRSTGPYREGETPNEAHRPSTAASLAASRRPQRQARTPLSLRDAFRDPKTLRSAIVLGAALEPRDRGVRIPGGGARGRR